MNLAPTPAAEPTAAAPEPAKPSLLDQLRTSAIFGSGFVGSGAIVWAVIELLKSEPDKGFKLLQSWGPWCFLVALGIWVVNGWVRDATRGREKSEDRMGVVLDRIIATQERLASAAEENAAAAKAQAAAQQQAADKDDRQMQELQTLTSYTSQETERTAVAVRQIAETTAENAKGIAQILDRLHEQPAVDINQVVAQAVTEYKRTESQTAQGV